MEVIRVVAYKGAAVGGHIAERAQVEPAIEETVDEGVGAGAGEEAARLRKEYVGPEELAGVRAAGEFGVRRGGPEKIRKARGESVGVERAVGGRSGNFG